MKVGWRFVGPLLLCLFAVCTAAAPVEAARLRVLTPSAACLVESRSINVVLRQEEEGLDRVEIGDGKRARSFPAEAMIHYPGFPLQPGMNTIRIAGFCGGRQVEEITIQVFAGSEFAESPSPGFPRYRFHLKESEWPCRKCHQLNFEGREDPAQPQDSQCYVCHRQVVAAAFVHGPAAVWSCHSCHQVNSEKNRNEVSKPDEKVCAPCHEDSLAEWQQMKLRHGPVAMGNCVACHDPHGSDEPFFLKLPAADLCAGCHSDVPGRPHMISAAFSNAGHPTRKSPDPFNPRRDFTCASCHNPHAGNTSVFIRSADGSISSSFCRSCHRF